MAKKKILIVEDEADMRQVLTLELEGAGYEVYQAVDGKAGFELASDIKPDCIISDVLMPNMDGNELRKMLHSTPWGRDIPFIVLTARGKMKDYFEAVDVDAFIAKPFEGEELLEKVAKVLKQQPSAKTPQQHAKVLVTGMDDETVATMVMKLKGVGFDTDFTTNGSEVISKAVRFSPDLLVFEVQMDGMATNEIIRVLRKMSQFEGKPILLYSFYRIDELGSEDIRQKALNVDSAQASCMEAGATAYIGRFNEHTFLKTVATYLKPKR